MARKPRAVMSTADRRHNYVLVIGFYSVFFLYLKKRFKKRAPRIDVPKLIVLRASSGYFLLDYFARAGKRLFLCSYAFERYAGGERRFFDCFNVQRNNNAEHRVFFSE